MLLLHLSSLHNTVFYSDSPIVTAGASTNVCLADDVLPETPVARTRIWYVPLRSSGSEYVRNELCTCLTCQL